jgi:hypothetical protein
MRAGGWCGSCRRGSGSVVTWRRAQMVLLSAQGMDATAIAKVAFTSEGRVRDVIHNFDADGFDSLYPGTAAASRRSSPWGSGGRSRRSPGPGQSLTACRFRLDPGQAGIVLFAGEQQLFFGDRLPMAALWMLDGSAL